ncbi:hypothetical protein tinsulaeT_05450 [Thalassotalea insulae]|uniref:Diguanylate cyclase/phosphodiesterase n=1 Tax=Thalassotalea insulae TaxID=2056778 RepID=A0ABQ6GMI5_9GAMM|nr:GGDEF domain-containing protein [Thalassotalea insulae]GLX77205.1 hypothetical protein tinsulaeT_05450 [Thalassotalea insulae]
MYTYSQMIAKNMLIAAVCSVLFSGVTFKLLSGNAEHQQKLQQQMLAQLYSQSVEYNANKIKAIAQPLTQYHFAQLEINSANAQQSYRVNNEQSAVAQLIAPEPAIFKLAKQQLQFKLQINTNDSATLFIYLSLTMMFLSFAIVLIGGQFSIQRYKNIIKSINLQIKNALTGILHAEQGADNKQTTLFDLPELNNGINEINEMVNELISDKGVLKKEAYIEPLTQFENRTRFVQYFESKNETVDFGVLTITRCSELQTVNQIHGYTEGDNYICKVADILKKACSKYQFAKIFRLNSSDFATILPNTTLKDAENYAEDISNYFNEYQQASDLDSVGYTGLVYFDKSNSLGELLALADTGISVAQTKQINAWYAQTDTDILASSSASYGNQNWRQEIDNVIDNHRVKLLVQQIKPTTRSARVYNEILARFLNSNEEMLPTASFIAMAEKLDKIVAIDKLIIETAITEISRKNLTEQHFGINISARTIHDEQFMIWLERRLLKEARIAKNLVFEISEFGLQQNIKTSKRFIDMIHRVGARITVERFGVGLTSFKFFRDLKPDFIKMDSIYTRDIDEDKNNQYFLRLMVDLAHRLSITVLAESVESQEEKFMLEKLFVDGCQGFYLGKPEAI